MNSIQYLQNKLEEFKSAGLKRKLLSRRGIDFSSNDYLGFAHDSLLRERFSHRIKEFPTGSTGSRLLRGNLALHEETEHLLAAFVQRESALLFSSGYMANVGLLSAVLGQSDLVFSDALNHASIIDGIQLSKAKKIIFPHRNYQYLETQLETHQAHDGLKVIVTESLFSMEGTLADLAKLAFLAEKFDALLIVDEAHSTGLWGASLVATLGLENKVFATTHTAGKSLGASGAWVAGSHLLMSYLIHFSRAFIFSTAPLPALPLLLQEAIKFYAEVGDERASVVKARAKKLHLLLQEEISEKESPIILIPVNENNRALQMSELLQQRGWDIRAIRPPTVPSGTARLRITVKWGNTEEQLEQLAKDVKEIFNR
jgi:8-amino-7-oxononanoate synthase